jgi:L-lactate dehydrogenase (cytochrome)
MSETTRRRFLEVAGAAAAATVLAPNARAATRVSPVPAVPDLPVKSPLPAGPGAPYSAYQSEIYIGGMGAGVDPIFTTNLSGLEAAAEPVLSDAARRHLLAAAGGPAAVRANARALDAWRIVPRMFIDRAERDAVTKLLGVTMAAPIILGPVGRQALAHRDAEAATAQAASAVGLTYVHPATASTPVEGVAVAAPLGSRWFGIDWPDAKGLDAAPLQRARLAGCSVLVVGSPPAGTGWDAAPAVLQAWDGPVVLSGVQTVTDARRAVRLGFAGIVVSNERGRRGAGVTGTIDVLPRIVDAVGRRTVVLFGSGARTGTDVFRALALGARAVIIGRPYVHGLALGGEPGVRHVLRTLLAELDITLAIAGTGDARELRPDALLRDR